MKFECDREVDRYDRDDMEEYVIKHSDGKSPPDGGKAQWIEYQKKLSGQGDVVPEPEPKPDPALRSAYGRLGAWF